ncbi:hypothetical protein AbraIFM66950_006878 [Aspergillus brasiliensis]|nr:hypothetical protein AbraIFM66950_006878 [Aspergillus brasiliensis]
MDRRSIWKKFELWQGRGDDTDDDDQLSDASSTTLENSHDPPPPSDASEAAPSVTRARGAWVSDGGWNPWLNKRKKTEQDERCKQGASETHHPEHSPIVSPTDPKASTQSSTEQSSLNTRLPRPESIKAELQTVSDSPSTSYTSQNTPHRVVSPTVIHPDNQVDSSRPPSEHSSWASHSSDIHAIATPVNSSPPRGNPPLAPSATRSSTMFRSKGEAPESSFDYRGRESGQAGKGNWLKDARYRLRGYTWDPNPSASVGKPPMPYEVTGQKAESGDAFPYNKNNNHCPTEKEPYNSGSRAVSPSEGSSSGSLGGATRDSKPMDKSQIVAGMSPSDSIDRFSAGSRRQVESPNGGLFSADMKGGSSSSFDDRGHHETSSELGRRDSIHSATSAGNSVTASDDLQTNPGTYEGNIVSGSSPHMRPQPLELHPDDRSLSDTKPLNPTSGKDRADARSAADGSADSGREASNRVSQTPCSEDKHLQPAGLHDYDPPNSHSDNTGDLADSGITHPSSHDEEASNYPVEQHQSSPEKESDIPSEERGVSPHNTDGDETSVIPVMAHQDSRAVGPEPAADSRSRGLSLDINGAEPPPKQNSTYLTHTADNLPKRINGSAPGLSNSTSDGAEGVPHGYTPQQKDTKQPNDLSGDGYSPSGEDTILARPGSSHLESVPKRPIKGNRSAEAAGLPKDETSVKDKIQHRPTSAQTTYLKHPVQVPNKGLSSPNEAGARSPTDRSLPQMEPRLATSIDESIPLSEPNVFSDVTHKGTGNGETQRSFSNDEDRGTIAADFAGDLKSNHESGLEDSHISSGHKDNLPDGRTEDRVTLEVHDTSSSAQDDADHICHNKSEGNSAAPRTPLNGDIYLPHQSTDDSIAKDEHPARAGNDHSRSSDTADTVLPAGQGATQIRSASDIPMERNATATAQSTDPGCINNASPGLSANKHPSTSRVADRIQPADREGQNMEPPSGISPDESSSSTESSTLPSVDNAGSAIPNADKPSIPTTKVEGSPVEQDLRQGQSSHGASTEGVITPTKSDSSAGLRNRTPPEAGAHNQGPTCADTRTPTNREPTDNGTALDIGSSRKSNQGKLGSLPNPTVKSLGGGPGSPDSAFSSDQDGASRPETVPNGSDDIANAPRNENYIPREPVTSPYADSKDLTRSEVHDSGTSTSNGEEMSPSKLASEALPEEVTLPTAPNDPPWHKDKSSAPTGIHRHNSSPQRPSSPSGAEEQPPKRYPPSPDAADHASSPSSDSPPSPQNNTQGLTSLAGIQELPSTLYETYIQEELTKALHERVPSELLQIFSNFTPERKEATCTRVTRQVGPEIEDLLGSVFDALIVSRE